jgi:hypothetical protein
MSAGRAEDDELADQLAEGALDPDELESHVDLFDESADNEVQSATGFGVVSGLQSVILGNLRPRPVYERAAAPLPIAES